MDQSILKLEVDYDRLAEAIVSSLKIQMPQVKENPPAERKKIRGIRGLASYIPCSVSKAQQLKNSGLIPYSEYGNRVFFYSDEIDEALRKVNLLKSNGYGE